MHQACRHLVSFSSLEAVMDTAATQTRRGADLPDGEASIMRHDDGPDPLVLYQSN
jgi:hypothetical protein